MKKFFSLTLTLAAMLSAMGGQRTGCRLFL